MRLLTRHTHILDVVDRSMNTDPSDYAHMPAPSHRKVLVCLCNTSTCIRGMHSQILVQ